MKNVRKRFLSLIMAMMMVLSCVATASAADVADTTSAGDDTVVVLGSTDGDEGIMPLAMDTLREFERYNNPKNEYVGGPVGTDREYSKVSIVLGLIGKIRLTVSLGDKQVLSQVYETGSQLITIATNLASNTTINYRITFLEDSYYVDMNLVGEY